MAAATLSKIELRAPRYFPSLWDLLDESHCDSAEILMEYREPAVECLLWTRLFPITVNKRKKKKW